MFFLGAFEFLGRTAGGGTAIVNEEAANWRTLRAAIRPGGSGMRVGTIAMLLFILHISPSTGQSEDPSSRPEFGREQFETAAIWFPTCLSYVLHCGPIVGTNNTIAGHYRTLPRPVFRRDRAHFVSGIKLLQLLETGPVQSPFMLLETGVAYKWSPTPLWHQASDEMCLLGSDAIPFLLGAVLSAREPLAERAWALFSSRCYNPSREPVSLDSYSEAGIVLSSASVHRRSLVAMESYREWYSHRMRSSTNGTRIVRDSRGRTSGRNFLYYSDADNHAGEFVFGDEFRLLVGERIVGRARMISPALGGTFWVRVGTEPPPGQVDAELMSVRSRPERPRSSTK